MVRNSRRRSSAVRSADLAEDDETRVVQIAQQSQHGVGTPLWWVNRLYGQLQARLSDINVYDDYYQGRFPLPWLAPDAEEEFRRIMRMSRANYCGLIVDAMVERMHVEGFRIDSGGGQRSAPATGAELLRNVQAGFIASPGGAGSLGVTKSGGFVGTTIGEADRETWRIWQANNMDAWFDQAMLEAGINGSAYLMVSPNNNDPRTPHMWIEHPSQCIVEYQPGTQRHIVAAGLKVWDDDWTGMVNATLYLPGSLYKFESRRPTVTRRNAELVPQKWVPRQVEGEEWPAATALDYVPIFELPNNPRLLSGGRSELSDLLDSQDRIVKTIADRLMTQDYGAFPQKWATGWPETDENGRPNQKINIGRDRLVTTDVPETRFGQFEATDLGGYMLAKKEDVHDMAARSRTPAQYLLGEFSNVNGETLKASESGLIAKVRQRMRGLDDSLEEAIRRVREMAGIATDDDQTMEIVWRNPEFKTEGEQVDALTKMSTLGVPNQALWERWGASPPEIQRWTEMAQAQFEMQAQMDATSLLADAYRRNNNDPAGSRASGGQDNPSTPGQNGSGSSAPSAR